MNRLALLLAALCAFLAAPAHAAAIFQLFTIPDPPGLPIEVGVWAPESPAGRRPLIVMSHGTGADFASHRDTAEALAEAGFVVAALTHTGENRRDQSRMTQVWDRPRQLKRLVDYMLDAWPGRDRINGKKIGAFGFSAGGFTVLVAAGGEPDLSRVAAHCRAHPDFFDCRLMARSPSSRPAHRAWSHDPRIKAVVAAAPALGFTFDRRRLAHVRQPVQLWRAAGDQILPHPYYAEAVRLALPRPPETHVVAGAGHFDFLAPCAREIGPSEAPICASAPGFDRAAFHAAFNRAVVDFFRRTLEPQRRGSASGS